ncbi:hypothetical protein THTE_3637 [Thermogutta terrifontis]|uniref:Uncharacterized protein n=1 Tax=Thermogutta terrifontis TaxID=1331910 RepID=A0A286RJU7_9BACT|nr:hypothetical protein THTE_3637 [Thermogutta terrifontis]
MFGFVNASGVPDITPHGRCLYRVVLLDDDGQPIREFRHCHTLRVNLTLCDCGDTVVSFRWRLGHSKSVHTHHCDHAETEKQPKPSVPHHVQLTQCFHRHRVISLVTSSSGGPEPVRV